MKPAPNLPARAWSTVALLWFVVLCNYLARMMVTTMHTSLVAMIPMTDAEFGLLTSVFLWTYGLLSPLAGFLSDRFSRKWVITLSTSVWSALTLLTAYARTFDQLVVMRILMGASEACYYPAALAMIADYHRGPTRAFATGLHQTGSLCALILAGFAGWLAELRGCGFAFKLVGATALAYCALLSLALRDAPKSAEPSPGLEDRSIPGIRFKSAIADLFSRGSFIVFVVHSALLGTLGWAIAGWIPTYLLEHFKLGQAEAGFTGTAYLSIASAIGLIAGGAWSDRWRLRNARGYILLTALGWGLAVPSVLLLTNTSILVLAIVGISIYGLAAGFNDCCAMPILCQITDRRYRATAYGVVNFVYSIAGGLAIYGTGLLRDRHYDTGHILSFSAALLVGCVTLLLWIRPDASLQSADQGIPSPIPSLGSVGLEPP